MNGHGDIWVFAYGSNMNVADLRRWFSEHGHDHRGILQAEPARLPGYRLVWNYYSLSRRGGAANIEVAQGEELPGVALNVNSAALEAIDVKEGHPDFYARGVEKAAVRLRSGEQVDAWVYMARPERCSLTTVSPRRDYLDLLISAAEEHGFPQWYLSQLRSTPTAD